MTNNATETAVAEIIAVRSSPSTIPFPFVDTVLAPPCLHDQPLSKPKVVDLTHQDKEFANQGRLAELGLRYHAMVSGILPTAGHSGRHALLRVAKGVCGHLTKCTIPGRAQHVSAGNERGAQQAERPGKRVGKKRSPERKVKHLDDGDPGRTAKDREDYNDRQHFRLIPVQLSIVRSCPAMAKLGQACDQSASSVAIVFRARVLALLLLAGILPGHVAAKGLSSEPPPTAFLHGDIYTGSAGDSQAKGLSNAGVPAAREMAPGLIQADYKPGAEPAPVAGPRPEGAQLSDRDKGPPDSALAEMDMSPDTVAHADNPAMAREHAALLALVPRDKVTDVAIADGSWFAGATWQTGQVPGPEAAVLIPSGVTVTYDGQSDVPLFSLRVDGALTFATDRDSRLVIDTMIVAPGGRLEIGTADQPVDPDVQAEILVTGAGEIDLGWDPLLLSRGVISHGAVAIHGARKTAFLKVAAAPMAGDQALVLAAAPEGWRVGDRLILTGTKKQGWAWDNEEERVRHHPSQDEVVTITAIDRNHVSIDRPLQYDHDTPRKDLAAYVANSTRNIVFASLAGAQTKLSQRGHVMFMHSDAVDIRYAAFDHLGRTDKSREAFDLSALADVNAASNIKGRYPLHLHKTGMSNQLTPAMVVGNSVFESPGWGFVQHSSHADFIDNVAFDVFGAAYAAEDGDETGIWLRNIAIRAQGFDWGSAAAKTVVDSNRHDNGRTGDGFFFAGRLVEAAENVAANTTHGFVWMQRSAPSNSMPNTIDQPELAYGRPSVPPPVPPIQGFRGNEAFGTEVGLIVIKANPAQGHDVRSVFHGFLNWETRLGVDVSYTGHYTFLDFDLFGTTSTGYFTPEVGFTFGTNAFDMVVNRIRLERFALGFDMSNGHTHPVTDADVGYVLIDVETKDLTEKFKGFSSTRHRLLTADDLLAGGLKFDQTSVAVGFDEDLPLWGDKQDSLGWTPRQKASDLQTIYRWEMRDLLRYTGYFTRPDGQKVVLVPDFVADRATGALKKFSFVFELNIPDWDLQDWEVVNRGVLDAQNSAPIAVDDLFAATVGQPLDITPLSNDSDPDGDRLQVQGTTDPTHGDVILLADGRMIYRPDHEYSGEDAFTYWAADGAGNYAPGIVRVSVTAP